MEAGRLVHLIQQAPTDACGVCGKTKYRTRAVARRQAAFLRKARGWTMRAYESHRCGCWHLTTLRKSRNG
jgi:hypothetical protein